MLYIVYTVIPSPVHSLQHFYKMQFIMYWTLSNHFQFLKTYPSNDLTFRINCIMCFGQVMITIKIVNDFKLHLRSRAITLISH